MQPAAKIQSPEPRVEHGVENPGWSMGWSLPSLVLHAASMRIPSHQDEQQQ